MRELRILQVSTSDVGGGAERVALGLHRSYRALQHDAWLAVGNVRSHEPGVLQIPNDAERNRWARAWVVLGGRLRSSSGAGLGGGLRRLVAGVAEPRRTMDRILGHEDFAFPGTRRLLGLTKERPTILHCHNLHGGYFDLRALPSLSKSVPTMLTLHDAWLLSGHCAHSFSCQRWETGCGHCPDLTIYPAVPRDATAFNWKRKRDLFARSRLHVSTPSQWLMDKVSRSMLAPGLLDARVIHNGVDLDIFHPVDRPSARAALDLPHDAHVLLFAAYGILGNRWKDFPTMRSALATVAERIGRRRVLFLALGEEAPTEHIGSVELRYLRHQDDPAATAAYYQAADIYVHAARVDTFPTTVLESLACGTPVVATSVGGIPEQIQDGRTGFLVQPGSPTAMAEATLTLLGDDQLRRTMSLNAAEDARARFDLRQQADTYLAWYREILGDGGSEAGR